MLTANAATADVVRPAPPSRLTQPNATLWLLWSPEVWTLLFLFIEKHTRPSAQFSCRSMKQLARFALCRARAQRFAKSSCKVCASRAKRTARGASPPGRLSPARPVSTP